MTARRPECEVKDDACLGRGGLVCYRCGVAVCRACSLEHPYLAAGKKRMCHPCVIDYEQGRTIAVDAHLAELAVNRGRKR